MNSNLASDEIDESAANKDNQLRRRKLSPMRLQSSESPFCIHSSCTLLVDLFVSDPTHIYPTNAFARRSLSEECMGLELLMGRILTQRIVILVF
ncbi:unnamed protein product [Dracunculus medinensis]|uniref:Uncharacterized protein n=1 Tax=Dracunculus medinensis TaxID=318479 RepID=A0A0N4U925_DRAME|nr:unnamed protein product [Dracunculus medinensis]